MGQYSEKLKTGGELIVTSGGWSIRYYFPGPDLRYNGTFVTVPGISIDDYIQAWRDNFQKYLQLKQTIPSGGRFETAGSKGMSIRIGMFEGVCLQSYHMPVSSESKLASIIADYKYAKKRGNQLMEILKDLK